MAKMAVEEAVADLVFQLKDGLSDSNYDYIQQLVSDHLDTNHPVILGIAEDLGII